MLNKFLSAAVVGTFLALTSVPSFAVGCAPGTLTVPQAKALLTQAKALGNSAAGRKIIVDLAIQVKAIAACDVALATELATLAATAPSWVQVAFGAELDGTGTASVGSPVIGGGSAAPGSPS